MSCRSDKARHYYVAQCVAPRTSCTSLPGHMGRFAELSTGSGSRGVDLHQRCSVPRDRPLGSGCRRWAPARVLTLAGTKRPLVHAIGAPSRMAAVRGAAVVGHSRGGSRCRRLLPHRSDWRYRPVSVLRLDGACDGFVEAWAERLHPAFHDPARERLTTTIQKFRSCVDKPPHSC